MPGAGKAGAMGAVGNRQYEHAVIAVGGPHGLLKKLKKPSAANRARSKSPPRTKGQEQYTRVSPEELAQHIKVPDIESVDMTSPEERLTNLSVECVNLEEKQDFEGLVDARIRSLALAQLCFGKEDPDVTLAYCRLAKAYLKKKFYMQAEAHALHALERVAFGNHDNADEVRVLALTTLGHTHIGHKKYNKALPLLSEAVELFKSLNESRPSELCEILDGISQVQLHQRYYAEAVATLEQIWELKEQSVGADALELLPIYARLGRSYLAIAQKIVQTKEMNEESKKYGEKAVEQLKRAISIGVANEKVCSTAVGNALFKLGSSQLLLGDHTAALENMIRATKIYTKLEGRNSKMLTTIMRQIALLHIQAKNPEKALDYLKLVTRAEKKRYGFNSEQVADLFKTRGDVHVIAKGYNKARECYETAMNIFEALDGLGSKRVDEMNDRLDRLEENEHYEQAREFHARTAQADQEKDADHTTELPGITGDESDLNRLNKELEKLDV